MLVKIACFRGKINCFTGKKRENFHRETALAARGANFFDYFFVACCQSKDFVKCAKINILTLHALHENIC
jgi:hypothetical protein